MGSVPAAVRAQMEALLLEPILEPFAQAFGEYGEFAKQAFAQALAAEFSRHA